MTPLVTTVKTGIAGAAFDLSFGCSPKKEKELRNRLAIGLLALMIVLAIPVLAQNDTGIISGRITDSSGAVVPNAQIVVTQTATNVETASAADADGIYRLPGLRDGPYKITVSAPGFKKLVREGLFLRIGQNLSVNLELQVGAVNESVDVVNTVPLLDTQTSYTGQVVEGDYFYELPNYQHWEKGVLYYTPQVESSNAPWPGALGNWNINGGQTWQTATYEDGIMSTTMDGGTTLNSVSVGDEEVQVVSSAMPAEYGHMTAGALIVVKKAGTNAIHGEGGWLFKNDLLYHRRFFQLQTTPQEGVKDFFQMPDFVVSGPVWIPHIYNGKNKTFFEVAGSYHIDSSSNASSYTIPTPQMLAGNYSAYSNIIYDPASLTGTFAAANLARTPFPNNTIPQSRFSSMWNAIAANNPFGVAPNSAGSILATGPNGNLVTEGTGHYFNKTTQFRVDHSLSDKFKVFASLEVGYQHQPAINADITYTPYDQYQVYTLTYQNVGMVGATYTLSPTLISETRVGEYRRTQNNVSPGGNYEFVTNKLVPNLPSNVYVNPISISGLSEGSNGSSQIGSGTLSINVNNIHQLSENLTKVKGTHAFKFGYEWLWENGDNHNIGNARLSLGFGGGSGNAQTDPTMGLQGNGNAISNTGGYGLANVQMGYITSYSYAQQGAPALPTDSIQSFFFQDDWRLTPKLTLNYGVRWSTETPAHNKFPGTMSNGSLTVADNYNYGGLPADQSVPGILTCPSGGCVGGWVQPKGFLWNRDYDHFTPRFGLAWNVEPNTVVRAGFAMMTLDYNTGVEQQQEIGGGSFYNQSVSQAATNVPGAFAPLFNINSGVPAFVSVAQLPNGEIPTSASSPSGRPTITWYPANYHNPYTLNWNVSIQRALKKNYMIQLSYVGMHNVGFGGTYNYDSRPYGTGIDSNGNVIDLTQSANWAYRNTWISNSSGVNGTQAYKPFPDLGGVNVECNCIQMVYHSGTVKIEKRYSYGLTFLAFFTYQKGIQNNGGGNLNQNQAEGRYVTGQTQKYRFVSSMMYELPFGKGKRWLNHGGVKNFFLGGYSFTWNYSIWAPTPEGIGYSGGQYLNPATLSTGGGRQDYPGYEDSPGGGIYLIQDPKLRSDWQDIGTARFAQATQNPLVTNCGVTPILEAPGITWGNQCEVVAPSFRLGNLPANEWIGQRIIGANASAFKNIPIKEHVQMQVRWDYFNPFKWFNWNQPNTTMTQSSPATFMTPGLGDNGDSTEGGPSEMQLSLRVRF
jgi:hypothetical protein